ncbi:rod shape-determining protein MreD [Candidatus Providencia siddallii]|uniref:Rod shape-determining protein MreD n=1 Tax=Candidatus Providencia siddallii TaxID=1715285 RepID=A0ABP1CE24_9GAMM
MNKILSEDKYTFVFLSFFVAFILEFILWPKEFIIYRPTLLFLVLFYWLIISPCLIGIWVSFFLGIIVDFIQGYVLGINALLFSIICYFLTYKEQLFRNITLWQQILLVILFTIVQNLVTFIIEYLFFDIFFSLKIFLNCVINGFIWPLLFLFFKKINC